MFFLLSCEETPFKVPEIGDDYFPLRKGLYFIYAIDSTGYSFNSPVQKHYQIKVSVADSFPNQDQSYTYVLKRFIRNNDTSPWHPLDTWSARMNDEKVIVNEQSKPFVKMTFPVRMGSSWNGNLYNNDLFDEYTITGLDQSIEIGNLAFDKVMTVEQEFNDDIIVFQDMRKELYARGVGLIKKEIVQLSYCTNDNCLGQQQVESGLIYKQEIIGYGKE